MHTRFDMWQILQRLPWPNRAWLVISAQKVGEKEHIANQTRVLSFWYDFSNFILIRALELRYIYCATLVAVGFLEGIHLIWILNDPLSFILGLDKETCLIPMPTQQPVESAQSYSLLTENLILTQLTLHLGFHRCILSNTNTASIKRLKRSIWYPCIVWYLAFVRSICQH